MKNVLIALVIFMLLFTVGCRVSEKKEVDMQKEITQETVEPIENSMQSDLDNLEDMDDDLFSDDLDSLDKELDFEI